jgi:hypothetical protein
MKKYKEFVLIGFILQMKKPLKPIGPGAMPNAH